MMVIRKTTARLLVLFAAPVASVVSASPSWADACTPGLDADCTPVVVTNWPPVEPQYVVAYIDDRQFTALLLLTAITCAVTLATFVWRASAGLRLGAHR